MFPAFWFHDEIIGNISYNVITISKREFKYKDKNLNENFASFLNSVVNRSNQVLCIKPPATMRAQLNKTSDRVIHLVKEIGDFNKYKVEQKKKLFVR